MPAPGASAYLPGSQAVHSDMCVCPCVLYPALHCSHFDSSLLPRTLEYLPTPQPEQFELNIIPTCSEYVPALQRVQTPSPTLSLYVSATHSVQFPAASRVYPALHRQSFAAVLAAVRVTALEGHVLHSVSAIPATSKYLPTAQSWHTPVFENLPASQSSQAVGVVAPVVSDALPARQIVQLDSASAPVPSKYFPTPHSLHDDDFVSF